MTQVEESRCCLSQVKRDWLKRTLAAGMVTACAAAGSAAAEDSKDPIVLTKMGAFAFAGKTIKDDAGRTLHCDHGYAQFQIPENPRKCGPGRATGSS